MALFRDRISVPKVRENFESRVTLEPEEKLAMLLDTSIWSNGKSGIVVTNKRVIEYDNKKAKSFSLEKIEGVKVHKAATWQMWIGLEDEEDQVLAIIDPTGYSVALAPAIEALIPGGFTRQPSDEDLVAKATAGGPAAANQFDTWHGVVVNGVMCSVLAGLGGSLIQARCSIVGWILLVVGGISFLSIMSYDGKQAWLKRLATAALLTALGPVALGIGTTMFSDRRGGEAVPGARLQRRVQDPDDRRRDVLVPRQAVVDSDIANVDQGLEVGLAQEQPFERDGL